MQEVIDYIENIKEISLKRDCKTLLEIMLEICQEKAKLWNIKMVGFGTYHYTYASGGEGERFLTGFSDRKQGLTIYIVAGLTGFEYLLAQLGSHTVGSSCLNIRRLRDIDLDILKKLITKSVKAMKYKFS